MATADTLTRLSEGVSWEQTATGGLVSVDLTGRMGGSGGGSLSRWGIGRVSVR